MKSSDFKGFCKLFGAHSTLQFGYYIFHYLKTVIFKIHIKISKFVGIRILFIYAIYSFFDVGSWPKSRPQLRKMWFMMMFASCSVLRSQFRSALKRPMTLGRSAGRCRVLRHWVCDDEVRMAPYPPSPLIEEH